MTSTSSKIKLTDLERDILRMIVGNMSVSEIAFALDADPKAVTESRTSIFDKLGAADANSAAEIAAKLKFVDLGQTAR